MLPVLRGSVTLRESLGAKRIYAREPKTVYVGCSARRTNDRLGNESSRMPCMFGNRRRVICSKEQTPRDFQRLVQALVAKSLPGSLKFGLSHCDCPASTLGN
jgi:hypothetical protein